MPSNHSVLCHPLLLCLQSFPASGSFPMSQLFESGSQSSGASALASVFPMSVHGWFPLGLTRLSQGTLKSLLQHHSLKASILWHSAFFMVQLSHPYMTTGKTIALTRWTSVSKEISLLSNILSRFVIAFLLSRKYLLISRLQSLSTVILEPKKIKSVTVFIFFPYICHEVMGLDAMTLFFWILSFKPAYSLSSFTFIKKLFSSSSLSAISAVSSAYLKLLIFLPAILIPACDSSSQISIYIFAIVVVVVVFPFSFQ